MLGLVGYALALPGVRLAASRSMPTRSCSRAWRCCAATSPCCSAIFAKTFAINEGLLPEDPRLTRFFDVVNLERGLAAGALAMTVGMTLLGVAIHEWWGRVLPRWTTRRAMPWAIPGTTLTALGFQTILSGFFTSILGMHRRS